MGILFSNKGEMFFFSLALVLYFLSPFIALPLICILMVFSTKDEESLNVIFLMLFAFYFSLLFFSRSYGINFSADTYDDAPGYYVWFSILRQNAIFDIFSDRELFYWLPFLMINEFYQVDEDVFFLINYVLMFSLFFVFSYKMYGNKALPFVYVFLFFTPASMYSFTHIFRQTFALLYFLFSIYHIRKLNFKLSVFFALLSVLSHNSFLIIVFSFFVSIFTHSRRIKIKTRVLGVTVAFIVMSLLFYFLPNIIQQLGGEISYKMEYYGFYDSFGKNVLTKQSLFVLIICPLFLFMASDNFSKIIITSVFITQLFGVLSGTIAITDRLAIATVPLIVVAIFNELLRSYKLTPNISNVCILGFVFFATIKTYLALINDELISRFWMKAHFSDSFYHPLIFLVHGI